MVIMGEFQWESKIENLLEGKNYKAMQLRSFRFDRFLKMAEKVDEFNASCKKCRGFKNEMIAILTQLEDDNEFLDLTFQKYLLLFRKLSGHLRKKHHLILPHYFSSKYSFIGMVAGLLISWFLWFVSGKTGDLAIDIWLLIMIGAFTGMVIGRVSGRKKDKQVLEAGKRIY
jgi:hypothetical protein